MTHACSNGSAHRGLLKPDSALRSLRAHLLLWVVAGVCLWVDLASKAWAFSTLREGDSAVLIPGLITARRSLNSGALFGSFSGWVTAFILASLLALGFVLYVFATSGRKQRFLHLGLAFILAGAMGNLYDRGFVEADVVTLAATPDQPGGQDIGIILSKPDAEPVVVASYPDGKNPRQYPREAVEHIDRHGVVRDFVKFTPIAGFDYWPWVFNVADALLVVGVCILLICFWRERRAFSPAAHPAASP
jgi:lipoprotein signal peptidase